jgi:very-short-patch-repair endonuclease
MRRHNLTEYAQQNRAGKTTAERALWQVLRKEQFGVKFRSQQPVGPYILDFYSAEVRLGIEVDGSAHQGMEAYDADRERRLLAEGILILRFTNQEVLGDLESVVELILQAVDARPRFRY